MTHVEFIGYWPKRERLTFSCLHENVIDLKNNRILHNAVSDQSFTVMQAGYRLAGVRMYITIGITQL